MDHISRMQNDLGSLLFRPRFAPPWRAFVASALVLVVWPDVTRAQHEEAVAPLMERLWSRDVRAVQPRAVRKAGALELLGTIGVIPNDPFVVYLPVGLWVGYHLDEAWAVELSLAYNVQLDTGLRDYLEDHDAQLRARIRERQQLRAGFGLAWSPVYGKIAVAGAILHLDLHLCAGAGLVQIEEQSALGIDAGPRADGYLGAGIRLFLTSRWLMRFDYRQHVFHRPEDALGRGGGVGFPAELALSAGLLIGGQR